MWKLRQIGGKGGTDKMFNLETGFKFCVTDGQTDIQAYRHYNMMPKYTHYTICIKLQN